MRPRNPTRQALSLFRLALTDRSWPLVSEAIRLFEGNQGPRPDRPALDAFTHQPSSAPFVYHEPCVSV